VIIFLGALVANTKEDSSGGLAETIENIYVNESEQGSECVLTSALIRGNHAALPLFTVIIPTSL
jgi:hypothetical protein